jgi:DNA-binding MarR family transcriptional regulator
MIELLKILRLNSPGLGLTSVEVLLLCAKAPQTMQDLQDATGCSNGQLSRAVRMLLSHYDHKAQKPVLRALNLLERRPNPHGRGYEIHLSSQGKDLLSSVGLCDSVGLSCCTTQ